VTDSLAILTSLDQFIERFASQNRLMAGHKLASQESSVANPNALIDHTIGHSGHFGHVKEEEALAGADDGNRNSRPCPAGDPDGGLARRIISGDGQSGQSGQSLKNHGLVSGHPGNACGQSGQSRWRALYEERSLHHELGGRSLAKAQLLAWRDLEWRWHKEYGERLQRGICGGCRKPIGTAAVIPLIDGNHVHRGEQHECLIAYGHRWRSAANAALLILGLKPPQGFGE
jgi:hypothetical protein